MIKRFRLRPYISLGAQQRIAWLLLILLVLGYAVIISDQAVLRYTTFKASAFDLGNMDQAFWNTIHGRPFQFTNQGSDNYGPPTRLATHVEPIILPLSVLYIFRADPRILLIFQTLALASGALPVFLLMRRQLPMLPLLAPFMALAYLLSPAVLGLNIYDFHPVSAATPLLLYAVLALTYRRYGWFVLACILASACKEDIPLAVAMLGILVIWKYKLFWLGMALFSGGLLWTAVAFTIVIPHFFPGAQHSNYWYRYAALGSSPGEAIVNILLHPWILLALFVTLDRIYYLASLLRSSGFLALLAPEWLLPILPGLAINWFADGSAYHSGLYHYNASIIPFVSIAAIYGMQRAVLCWSSWQGLALPMEADVVVSNERLIARKYRIAAGLSVFVVWSRRLLASILSLQKKIVPAIANYPFVKRRRLALTSLRCAGQRQQQRLIARMSDLARVVPLSYLQGSIAAWIVAMVLLNIIVANPLLNIFWADHRPGDREQQIERLLALIPADASVSAGGNLNPHLTDRRYVTVFPEITFVTTDKTIDNRVKYIVVDLDNLSPEDKKRSANFLNVLNKLRRSHQFRQIGEADGVILLVRDSP